VVTEWAVASGKAEAAEVEVEEVEEAEEAAGGVAGSVFTAAGAAGEAGEKREEEGAEAGPSSALWCRRWRRKWSFESPVALLTGEGAGKAEPLADARGGLEEGLGMFLIDRTGADLRRRWAAAFALALDEKDEEVDGEEKEADAAMALPTGGFACVKPACSALHLEQNHLG
jgi:hypothetical protein